MIGCTYEMLNTTVADNLSEQNEIYGSLSPLNLFANFITSTIYFITVLSTRS